MSPMLKKAAIAAAEVVREQKNTALYFDGMAIARAVLRAVWEPDDEMLGAASPQVFGPDPMAHEIANFESGWIAAVEHILSEDTQ